VTALDYFTLTFRRLPTLASKFRQLRETGVTMLVGTDSGIPGNFHTDSTWRELETWVKLGATPMQAIAGATRWPARFLKQEKELGTLAPGRYADVIAVAATCSRTSACCSASTSWSRTACGCADGPRAEARACRARGRRLSWSRAVSVRLRASTSSVPKNCSPSLGGRLGFMPSGMPTKRTAGPNVASSLRGPEGPRRGAAPPRIPRTDRSR
jgi:hypothetical protein